MSMPLVNEDRNSDVNSIACGKLNWIYIETPTTQDVKYLAQNFNFHPLNLDERQKMIHRLKHQLTATDPTEVRQVLRGIIQRIIVERQEKTIQGHITFYYPPVPVKKRN